MKWDANESPLDSLELINRGKCLENSCKFAEALASYDLAFAVNPKDSLALVSKGRLLEAMHEFTDALEAYNLAVEVNPQHTLARIEREQLQNKLGGVSSRHSY